MKAAKATCLSCGRLWITLRERDPAAKRIEALEKALQQVANWVRQNPEANAGDRAGDELLDIVRSIAALANNSEIPTGDVFD